MLRPYCILPAPHPLDEFITRDLLARFFQYVAIGDRCWLWTGCTAGMGYGVFTIGGVNYFAHRLAYHFAYGPIPAGLFICHRCDTRRCVRADHLFAGTHAENMADQLRKGRKPHGIEHWQAKLTDDDVREIRRRYAAGEQQRTIAKSYHLHPTTVWDIVHGHHWKHVD